MYCIHVYTYCMTHCTVPHHTMFVLCTDAVITLCCTIILCCTCWNYDCTMQHNIPHCTALMWGHPTYMSMTVMRRCDVDLGGCRAHLIGDTDVTNSTISLPPWWHQSYMKAYIATKPHTQINMSNQLPCLHPHSPRHMMVMNRAWNVRKPLYKEMRSARKRLRLGQSFLLLLS